MKCDYGCNNEAIVKFKNGKWCCSNSPNSCPEKKKKYNQYGTNNPMFGKKPWNKGLTKELDNRIKNYGLSVSKTKKGSTPWNKGLTIESSDIVKLSSEKMAITKKGKPNIKRRKPLSISKIRTKIRLNHIFRERLYCDFTYPVMNRDNFKCIICDSKENLEVHHLKPFREIMKESINELKLSENILEWKDNDLILLENKILSKHNINIGITLCMPCHREIDKWRK